MQNYNRSLGSSKSKKLAYVSSPKLTLISTSQPIEKETLEEKLFGNQIREAIAIIKDWIKNP